MRLSRDRESTEPGVWALQRLEGFGRVGDVIATDDTSVVRDFRPLVGPVPKGGWASLRGVSRSDRWRLASRHASDGDVGETSAVPLLDRVSRSFGAKARLDVSGGALVSNRLTLRDSGGHVIAPTDGDPAAAMAAALSLKF